MNWHQVMEKAFEALKSSGAAAAEPILLQALELAGQQAEYRAMTYFNLALCVYDLKRPKESEAYFIQAIELVHEQLPKLNELYGMFLKTIIEFYEKENRLVDSKKFYLLEIDHTRNMYGAKHPYVANIICEYSDLQLKTGDFAEAEKYLCRALDIMTAARGPDHGQNASIHTNLAKCYMALARREDAEYHKARAEAITARVQKQKAKGIDLSGAVEQPLD